MRNGNYPPTLALPCNLAVCDILYEKKSLAMETTQEELINDKDYENEEEDYEIKLILILMMTIKNAGMKK